jgi:long-chain acyl-CoA synthetase
MNVLDGLRRAAQCYPDKLAIIDGEVKASWREFDERTRKLAAGLAGLGLQKGDRLALLTLNSFRYLETYYAAARLGLVVVPLNIRFSPQEIVYSLTDSDSVALMVDDLFAPLVAKARDTLPDLKHYIHWGKGDTPDGLISYEGLVDAGKDWHSLEEADSDPEDLAGIFYTGGTTGFPKGVMLSHKNLVTNAFHVAQAGKDSYHDGDRYLHVAPMFHLADGASTYAVTMVGGTHVFMPMFDPVKFLECVQRDKVTAVLLVPTMINALLQIPGISDYDLSSWRFLLYGASPIPVEVLKKAMQTFPCKFAQGYGMTEAAPLLTRLTSAAHEAGMNAPAGSPEYRRLMSAGQPCLGVQVKVVKPDYTEVKPGEIGEVIARGPNIMKGYWKKADESAYGLRDGWLHTGDLATIDEEYFIYIVDRAKDMIVSGGENVYSVEVENALYKNPAVLEAAVIGVPDDKWGERVHAVVVFKPDMSATEDELMETCREHIGGYKLPRSFEFVDALPKSGAGKILKRTLREKYWQDKNRRVN